MFKVNTDPKIIDEILERGISRIYPSKEDFKKALLSGKRLRIYNGADPTGPELHLGHSTNLIFLEKLRKLGHEVTFLFGDFTAMIGDPTDKSAARKRLSKTEVGKNMATWKNQASKILDFKDRNNPPKIVKNSKWLAKLNFTKILELMAYFTNQQMIERDMFQDRLKKDKPIYMHEFIYPLMQGYDSVVLDVDAEVGGTDQTFNMLVGRTLQEKINKKNKFVVTTTLLENPRTGKKLMNKSEGTYISLNEEPNNMFGKIMALPDETIFSIFINCTYISMSEIEKIKNLDPRDAKMRLAFEIVKIYHGENKAKEAEDYFIKTFQKKEIPEDVLEIKVVPGSILSDILVENKLVKSKSEFSRLVDERAIHDLANKTEINDYHFKIEREAVLKIGKKRFVRLVIT